MVDAAQMDWKAIETVRLMNETQEKSYQLKHQAEQLAEWNSALESRVAEQLSQIERLTRLVHELELAGRIQTGMLPRFLN